MDGETLQDTFSLLRISRGALAQLRYMWRTRQISGSLKLGISTTNVLSVLLYAWEIWKLTMNRTGIPKWDVATRTNSTHQENDQSGNVSIGLDDEKVEITQERLWIGRQKTRVNMTSQNYLEAGHRNWTTQRKNIWKKMKSRAFNGERDLHEWYCLYAGRPWTGIDLLSIASFTSLFFELERYSPSRNPHTILVLTYVTRALTV